MLLLSTGADNADTKQEHTGGEESTVHAAILPHQASVRQGPRAGNPRQPGVANDQGARTRVPAPYRRVKLLGGR